MANSRTPGALGGICWAIIFHVQESPPHTQSDSNWQLVERHTAPRSSVRVEAAKEEPLFKSLAKPVLL
eukprot:CAMPEP_0115705500 /NCGR_PEP_ID=MMETSP0272-20121206/70251_1 /TAXON_ID=71861 /ORGANISM="Scrippsiella trochoidea, Strain CCMP3099" /LENGTH=67 /DNA_ID=CAMNT_0003146607 /DNA_START=222 /DNA_END=422 /DNA_ORIENTATION=+